MLSVNKPLMDAAFNKLCIKGTGTYTSAKSAGTIYKAAYEAYYNKAAEKLPKSDPDDKDLQDKLRSEGLLVNDIKKQLEDDARFCFAFCRCNERVLKRVSTQIDAHIKSASINITIPALLPTIISPMGPCTGSLTIGEATGAIINIM